MKVVGILGSARKNGNTEILLDVALREAQEKGAMTSKIALRDRSIAPCDGCGKCVKTGKCVIKDDMEEIYEKMLESEGIVWATPVYFWSMTGLTKTVMDRTFALAYPRLQLMNKVGGLILVAGTRGCMNTANIFHMYFSYYHMFFAEFASGYAGAKGEIKNNAVALNSSRAMVGQMISLIQAGLRYPEEYDSPLIRYTREKYGM